MDLILPSPWYLNTWALPWVVLALMGLHRIWPHFSPNPGYGFVRWLFIITGILGFVFMVITLASGSYLAPSGGPMVDVFRSVLVVGVLLSRWGKQPWVIFAITALSCLLPLLIYEANQPPRLPEGDTVPDWLNSPLFQPEYPTMGEMYDVMLGFPVRLWAILTAVLVGVGRIRENPKGVSGGLKDR